MKAPKIAPCALEIPEPLLRAADEAERRKNDALGRLTDKLAEHLPPPPPLDDFGAAMEALIDADKRVTQVKGK